MGVKMPPKAASAKKDEFVEHLVTQKAVGVTTHESKTSKAGGGDGEFHLKKETQEVAHGGIMLKADELMMMEVLGSKTTNLGNYESARISVALRVPCTKEDLEETYQWAENWVSDKITKATEAV